MLSEIDSRTLSEYMVYDRLEPIGDAKTSYMLAQLTALTANVAGGKTTVGDWLPKSKETKPISVIDKIKAVFGGSRRNITSNKD